ncbi:MAG: hypothetical protein H8E67_08370, partial [Proteobacteria bacterium]|nr:hypothetical protein [Pseudomonadota bacterium]
MSQNKLIYLSAFIVFVGLTVYALWNEVSRETTQLKYSISGISKPVRHLLLTFTIELAM